MSGRGPDARRQGFASAESVEAGNARFESGGGGTFKGPDQGSVAEGGKNGVSGAADGAPDAAAAKGGFAGRAGSAIAAGFVGELDDSDELSGSEGAYRAGRAAADIRKRRRARPGPDPFAPVENAANNVEAVAAKEAKRVAGEAGAVAGPGGSAEGAPRSKSLLARAKEGLGGKAARRSAATGGKAAGANALGEAQAASNYARSRAALQAAYSQLGVPYVWGGSTPGVGLDCSGLTQYCYRQAGISISHYTEDQLKELTVVPLSQARPGDILYKYGHVAIYVGGDEYIHEPRTGDVCRKATGISYFTCALRYTG